MSLYSCSSTVMYLDKDWRHWKPPKSKELI